MFFSFISRVLINNFGAGAGAGGEGVRADNQTTPFYIYIFFFYRFILAQFWGPSSRASPEPRMLPAPLRKKFSFLLTLFFNFFLLFLSLNFSILQLDFLFINFFYYYSFLFPLLFFFLVFIYMCRKYFDSKTLAIIFRFPDFFLLLFLCQFT